MKKQLLFAAGLTFLVGTGIGPVPDAGAQPIPDECPPCVLHNSQPGNGPGMTVKNWCDNTTGEGGIETTIVNKTKQILVVELVEASGFVQAKDIKPGETWVAFWPGGDDDTVQFVHRVFDGVDRGIGILFDCPCADTGPLPAPPVTVSPPGGGPDVPTPAVGARPPTVVGRLPSVGVESGLTALVGLIVLGWGVLFIMAARQKRAS